MRRVKILEGQAFAIWAVDLASGSEPERCPAKDFIRDLPSPALKSVTNTLRLHAEQGPLKNETRSRALRDGIYEFKTPQGHRLLYFYSGSRITVLSHGFKKGAKINSEIQRAKSLRSQWEEERA